MDELAGIAGRAQPVRAFPRADRRSGARIADGARARSGLAARRTEPDAAVRGLVVLGIWLAWYLYIKRTELPEKIAKSLGGFYKLLYNKYYVDQIYDAMFVNRTKDLGLALGAFDAT